jgi:hypothetical protein
MRSMARNSSSAADQPALQLRSAGASEGDGADARRADDGDPVRRGQGHGRLAQPTARNTARSAPFSCSSDASGADRRQRLRRTIDDDALQVELEPVEHGRLGASDAPAGRSGPARSGCPRRSRRDTRTSYDSAGPTTRTSAVAQRRLGARVEVGRACRCRSQGNDGEGASKKGR